MAFDDLISLHDLSREEVSGILDLALEIKKDPQRWHVNLDGESHGPITLGEVERYWEDGKLNADSTVWAEGMDDWQPLVDVPELAHLKTHPQAEAAPVAPPPEPASAETTTESTNMG